MRYVVWTTDLCNLKCSYCYEKNSVHSNGIISSQKRDEIIKFVKNNAEDMESITFHGAEPLLGFNFIQDFVKDLYECNPNIQYDFTTNGTILSHEIEDFLSKYKSSFKDISISIDGTEESHNLNRKYKDGNGSYEIVKENTLKYLKIFPNLRGRMTVTSNNVHNLFDNVLSVHNLGINIVVPSINYYDEQWDESCFDILASQVKLIHSYCSLHPNLEVSILDEIKTKRHLGRCGLSQNIYIDGNIYPCMYAVNNKELIIGDVLYGINKSQYNRLCESNNMDNEFCMGCTNIKYCINNRCKYMNLSITGNMYIPSKVGCQFEHFKLILSKNAPEVFS